MSILWNTLTPCQVVESVKELEPETLKAQGITAVITDLDNTLVPWRHYEIMPGVIEWLAKLEVAGSKSASPPTRSIPSASSNWRKR